MKKFLAITILILALTNVPLVSAQTPTNNSSKLKDLLPTVVKEKVSDKKSDIEQQKITNLKTRADLEIDKRIKSLNDLIGRINSMKKLSTENKSSMTTQIQAQINNLTTLKAKIDADTDLTILKADVKSIVDSYKIYALFIPKVHILAASDMELVTADELSTLAAKLEIRIQEAQNAGENVATLQTAIKDLQTKANDAKDQAQNAELAVLPLTPEGFPGNKSTLQNARSMIRKGHQYLLTARKDARTIIQGLKQMKLGSGNNDASSSSEINTPVE